MMNDELPLAPLAAAVARLRVEAGVERFRQPVLDRALNNLDESIEELEVASEELQVRNEELRLVMIDLDGERRRYRDLFDLAADGYLVTDAQGVVIEANRAAGELLGRPAESLLGCRMGGLIGRGRPDVIRRLRVARTAPQGEEIFELGAGERSRLVQARHRRRDGEAQTHWTLTSLERPIFESEAATRPDAAMARRWLGIYGELVAVTESLLEDVRDRAEALSRTARAHVVDTQIRPLDAHLARLQRRRDHWSERHAEMVGLELSPETGTVRYGDRIVQMTRREQQLLRFLIDRPGSFYPSRVLLVRAWHASYLSEEQVRTYIGRLRRKLTDLDLPCELVTQRPQGYALVFAEGNGDAPSPSPV